VAEKIMEAFNPVINLIQGIAYPLAYITLGTGVCLIIIGQKSEGLKLMKWAGIGYILMQWLPGLMKMMYTIGQGMK
jgi:hypothetical protein